MNGWDAALIVVITLYTLATLVIALIAAADAFLDTREPEERARALRRMFTAPLWPIVVLYNLPRIWREAFGPNALR